MRNFRELETWKNGLQLTRLVYKQCSLLAENEIYRSSENDFCIFLEIALGSTFELETQQIIIKEQKWAEQKMLNSFQLAVKVRSRKPNTQNLIPKT